MSRRGNTFRGLQKAAGTGVIDHLIEAGPDAFYSSEESNGMKEITAGPVIVEEPESSAELSPKEGQERYEIGRSTISGEKNSGEQREEFLSAALVP